MSASVDLERHADADTVPAALPSARLSVRALALGLLTLYAALLGTSMIDESPTTDEPVHLTRGLAYFWGPDASLSWAHPPLGNAIAALPIVLTTERIDLSKFAAYSAGDVGPVAEELFTANYAERRPWFFEARAMVACMALLLALYMYRLGTRLYGPAVGLCTLAFFTLHPTLIGHGRTVTTDMPLTLALIVAVGELAVFMNGAPRWHGVAAAAAVAAALATKYSALVIVPFASLVVLSVALLRVGRFRALTRSRAVLAACVYIAFSGIVSLLAINAVYRFENTCVTAGEMLRLPEPVRSDSDVMNGSLLESASLLPNLPSWLPIPLPFTYVFGLSFVSTHNETGHSSYFMGKRLKHGHPAYFPVLLLIKTPLVLLLALGYAGYLFIRRRGRVGLPALLIAAYALGFVLLSTRAGINIGIRHILPMLPCLTLFAGLGAVYAWRDLRDPRRRRWLAGVAAAASLLGVAWSFPDYIADFNILVGGRRGGERISIVGEEWGQDTLRLGRALHERGIREVYFSGHSFIAGIELARHQVTSKALGCPNELPESAFVAVRARERERRACYRWSRKRKSQFNVARHVFIYRTSDKETPL